MPGPSGKTLRRELPYGLLGDTPDFEADSRALAEALDQFAKFNQGLLAARPAAGASKEGDIYWATNDTTWGPNGTWWILYGGAWTMLPLPTVTEAMLASALLGPSAANFGLRKLGTGGTEAMAGNDTRITERGNKDFMQPGVVEGSDWKFAGAINAGTGELSSAAGTGGKAWMEDPSHAGQLIRSVTASAVFKAAPSALPVSGDFINVQIELAPSATWNGEATVSAHSGVQQTTQALAESNPPATTAGRIAVKRIIIKNTAGVYSIVNEFDVRALADGEQRGYYGDGSTGYLMLDGTNAATGFSRSGSEYTCTQDIYALNMIVKAGVTVKTNGMRIFVQNILTNEGTIDNSGAAGTAGTKTEEGKGGAAGVANVLNGGSAGGRGGKPIAGGEVGVAATSIVSNGFGGAGGTGGTSNPGKVGGSGGSMTHPPGLARRNSIEVFEGEQKWKGGAGGGGGGSAELGGGGGGGGGGGIVLIAARYITNSGTIRANGGNGGNEGENGAGGGGGGGGAVYLIRGGEAAGGTVQANGGTHGNSSGANGEAGIVVKIAA